MPRSLSAEDIRRMILDGLSALEAARDEIDALNVFPVPDGDTGTNMFLTMQSVVAELNETEGESVPAYAKAIKDGSLKGARGNSGVILSQILRGICDVLIGADEITATVIAKALSQASRVAYEAVMKPVEGTMLTVTKDMAKAARKTARKSEDIADLLKEVLKEGKASLARTPDLLDVLREAGVVDAGGLGLVVLAESALMIITGERVVVPAGVTEKAAEVLEVEPIDLTYLYCTEFMIKGEDIDAARFKKNIEKLGDSMLVVGDNGVYRTHIHTNEPGKVLQIATKIGELSQVRINNMKEQSEERARMLAQTTVETKERPTGTAIVAVAAGEGVKQILRSLGVDRIVNGGQTMNPSAADIATEIDKAGGASVIVLPNNKNIILTASQAGELTKKTISVVPTRSIPEAFAALLTFDAEKGLDENHSEMEGAILEVKTGEVTHASRDSKTAAGRVKKGDVIGIYDDKIVASGHSVTDTGFDLVSRMLDETSEVVTILAGAGVPVKKLESLKNRLLKEHPGIEIEIHAGDQPLYPLIIGVE